MFNSKTEIEYNLYIIRGDEDMQNQILDVLDRNPFIDRLMLVTKFLTENKRGGCFGIDGLWGSGKSFVLKRFEERLGSIQSEDTADNQYFIFHYDCWKYDYYEEPAIAIVSAMLDVATEELGLLGEEGDAILRKSWETAKKYLEKIAGEFCKNKIGINLVDLAALAGGIKEAAEKEIDDNKKFDELYAFKKTLEKTRESIENIAEKKTVVIVVDELDRCLPEYSIKVLERLHHIFYELNNVIVIIAMDKEKLTYSIKKIYGEIDVDEYLRKFIEFKLDLSKGEAKEYDKKYPEYFSKFQYTEAELIQISKFLMDILQNIDIRTQERIFRKAEIVHGLITEDKYDASILMFEILFLTIAHRMKNSHIDWLCRLTDTQYDDVKKKLGKKYYEMLQRYEGEIRRGGQREGYKVVNDSNFGKAFFWVASIFNPVRNGRCAPYFLDAKRDIQKEIDLVQRFGDIISFIDCD